MRTRLGALIRAALRAVLWAGPWAVLRADPDRPNRVFEKAVHIWRFRGVVRPPTTRREGEVLMRVGAAEPGEASAVVGSVVDSAVASVVSSGLGSGPEPVRRLKLAARLRVPLDRRARDKVEEHNELRSSPCGRARSSAPAAPLDLPSPRIDGYMDDLDARRRDPEEVRR